MCGLCVLHRSLSSFPFCSSLSPLSLQRFIAEGEVGLPSFQAPWPYAQKLKMFVVQEPVVAASCLIAGFGLFLPAVVRPILDSFETAKQVPQPILSHGQLIKFCA
ncbi:hypothetical protein Taro_027213 [Colocasia esculenta]|uniref:Uncharacterized protein n=1 Tax=Colocasia esculenta TaxID=4460 RepID=A0A843VDZ1_COLES|nr:hypothetical protein [Colocasia esculenta]